MRRPILIVLTPIVMIIKPLHHVFEYSISSPKAQQKCRQSNIPDAADNVVIFFRTK